MSNHMTRQNLKTMKNTCLSMTRLLVLILAAVLVNAQVIEIKSNFDKDPLKDLHVVYGKKHKECTLFLT